MTLSTQTVTVTPKLATDWLNSNTHNRPLKNSTVADYADQMKRGLWKLNGEALIFSGGRHPKLLDGQHRLYACIESGRSFTTLVVKGIDEDTFDTIDRGVKRSAADILAIAGYTVDAGKVAPAANLALRYLDRKMLSRDVIPAARTLEFVKQYPELAEWVALSKSKGWTSAYAATLAAIMFLASNKHPQKAREFITKFTSGENLSARSPILLLRNRLGTEKRLPKMHRTMLIVMAWNAFVQGRELSKLQSSRMDQFPPIIGAK